MTLTEALMARNLPSRRKSLRTSMQTCFHDSTRPIFALLTLLVVAGPAAAERGALPQPEEPKGP